MAHPKYAFWVDIETTGLDTHSDQVLEVAMMVTDGPDIVDYYSSPVYIRDLHIESDFVRGMHERNGLLSECRDTQKSLPLGEIEKDLLAYMDVYVGNEGKPPLGGSSVAFDRAFLGRDMPELIDRFHYRNLDVSSIKEAMKYVAPSVFEEWDRFSGGKAAATHRALDDVKATFQEFTFYASIIKAGATLNGLDGGLKEPNE